MENKIKTKFSLKGLLALLFAAFPSLVFHSPLFNLSNDLFSIIVIMSLMFLLFSIVLVRNYKEPEVNRKSKIYSLASIFYGMYFLLMVLYGIRKAGVITAIVAHGFGFLFLIFFSIDRKNWLSMSASILTMILFILRESLIAGNVL